MIGKYFMTQARETITGKYKDKAFFSGVEFKPTHTVELNLPEDNDKFRQSCEDLSKNKFGLHKLELYIWDDKHQNEKAMQQLVSIENALKNNTTINTLILGSAEIIGSFLTVAKILSYENKINEVIIGGVNMSIHPQSEIAALATAISHNKYISFLTIDACKLNKFFITSLDLKNCTLKKLAFSDNGISFDDDFLEELCQHLENNKTIEELIICNHKISNKGVENLLKILPTMTAITKVTLKYEGMDKDIPQKIESILDKKKKSALEYT